MYVCYNKLFPVKNEQLQQYHVFIVTLRHESITQQLLKYTFNFKNYKNLMKP